MVTYDFACENCKSEFYLSVNYSDRDLKRECPDCGQTAAVRVWRQFPGLTKASYIDGRKGKHSDDIRKIADLQVKHAASNSAEERAGLGKEISDRQKL